MIKLLSYLLRVGLATNSQIPDNLTENSLGLPKPGSEPCHQGCAACIECCPTDAIALTTNSIRLDWGACIGCGECVQVCPTGTLIRDLSTSTYSHTRDDLIKPSSPSVPVAQPNSIFKDSLAVRVVSTGCTACDLEISAAGNPIFDVDRFGISIVASPRFADALLVTGPVPKAMQKALQICYEAMPDPKIVIACGTCAISGGTHKGGYADGNGLSNHLPIDIFIPGCPPHPWQIVQALLAAKKLKA